jgi:hypothetical protein
MPGDVLAEGRTGKNICRVLAVIFRQYIYGFLLCYGGEGCSRMAFMKEKLAMCVGDSFELFVGVSC